MPRWNIKTIIGATDLSTCRCLITGRGQFMTNFRGSVGFSASGAPKALSVQVGTKGNVFGVTIPYCPAALLTAIAAELNAKCAADPPTSIRVQLQDALVNIDVQAFPDFNQDWIDTGPESEGIIQNVVLRFISAS